MFYEIYFEKESDRGNFMIQLMTLTREKGSPLHRHIPNDDKRDKINVALLYFFNDSLMITI